MPPKPPKRRRQKATCTDYHLCSKVSLARTPTGDTKSDTISTRSSQDCQTFTDPSTVYHPVGKDSFDVTELEMSQSKSESKQELHQETQISGEASSFSMINALKSQNEAMSFDLRQFISDSLKENSVKLRSELRSVLNEIIENQRKEWAAFKHEIDCKIAKVVSNADSNSNATDQNFLLLNEKVDNLSLSVDQEKLDILSSLSKDDLLSTKQISHRVSKCESAHKMNTEKIGNLMESFNFNEKQNSDLSSELKEIQKTCNVHDSSILSMEVTQGRLKNRLVQVESRSVTSDTRHRRLNLIFEGVDEKVSENTKQEIVNLLRRSNLQCPPTADQISTAYRLGKYSENSTRPILVAFKDQQIKDTVLKSASSIKKSLDLKNLWINRDHPDITRRQIANTRRCFNLLKANGHECRMHGTSITFNTKTYHYKDLNSLPASSRLEDTKLIPCNEGKGICFQGDLCYLSNMYPAPLVYKRTPFLSSEQAFQWDKATQAKKHLSAKQILHTENPFEAKRIGDLIDTSEAWDQTEIDTLRNIVTQKFIQNNTLLSRLIKSDYEQFYECTTSTKWGTGILVSNRQVDTSTFVGENKFGKLLAEVKSRLKSQFTPA